MQALENKIEQLLTPSLTDMGYDIVRIKLFSGEPKSLQIMAERNSDQQLGIDDCTKISKAVSTILDVEDPISGEYNLEVSSPGIDRPLVKSDDFVKYANNDIKLTTKDPIDGQKRFKGRLLGLSEDKANILLKENNKEENTTISFDNMESAKIVINDNMINN